METSLILLIFGALVLAGLYFLYQRINSLGKNQNDESALRLLNETFNARMREMTQQFQEQTRQLNFRLKESSEMFQHSNKNIGDRLDTAAKVVSGVTDRLSKMEEANKRIFEVGKDIASLQDILRAPKLRGSLGEFFLGDLLAQYFPKEQFTMPYTFRSGEKVDAVLHLADNRMVPIDSKFPLENFQKMMLAKDEKEQKQHRKAFMRDLENRIDEVARYILPDEGTVDFALLYIPAENVYYEVIVKDELEKNVSNYALQKRVIPVSPNNFFIYIQTILMGLRGLQIEHSAKEIQEALVRLKGDFGKFGAEFEVLGGHLTNANNKFEESRRRLDKIGQKLENVELMGEKEEKRLLA
ncbi:DNA recombination protein RmuC [Candidatus Peregrinibacteria bacterium]|nr:DNA recombination protein RmuC [Candidatus Peregrinibacteria bacterium]